MGLRICSPRLRLTPFGPCPSGSRGACGAASRGLPAFAGLARHPACPGLPLPPPASACGASPPRLAAPVCWVPRPAGSSGSCDRGVHPAAPRKSGRMRDCGCAHEPVRVRFWVETAPGRRLLGLTSSAAAAAVAPNERRGPFILGHPLSHTPTRPYLGPCLSSEKRSLRFWTPVTVPPRPL